MTGLFARVPAPGRGALSLAALFLIIIFFAAYHGIYRPYTTTPDADLIYVYQSLLINDGRWQEYHDHTGYVYFLLLSLLTRILAWLGAIPVYRLSELTDPDQIEPAFAMLVYAGRWLSVVLATLFAWRFCKGLRLLTESSLLALTTAVVLAVSPGVISHALLLRTELPAALFYWEAFLCLILATRTGERRALVWLALSAFFALVSLESKMQVIPLLLTFPFLAAAFRRPPPVDSAGGAPSRFSVEQMLFIVAALALSVPAATMITGQIEGNGGYQSAIVGYVIISVWVYGWFFDIPWRRRILALCAVLIGAAAGQLVHLITNDPVNTKALANFVEHMANFADGSIPANVGSPGMLADSIITKLAESGREAFAINSLLSVSGPLTGRQILYWSVCLGIVASFAAHRRILALRCGLLLMVAFAMEVFCGLRGGFPVRYLIFVDPWLFLALGFLLAETFWRRLVPTVAAVALLATISAVNIESSLQRGMITKHSAHNVCSKARAYLQRLPGAFDKYCD